MKRFLHDNGLSLTIFGLFLTFLVAESVAGLKAYNNDRRDHQVAPVSYLQFLSSGRFIEATAENWESEFLEMAFYAMLTSFLYQRGSAESKTPGKRDVSDRSPRPDPEAPWPVRHGGLVLKVYERSLSLGLLLLFMAAFLIHAAGGARDYNLSQAEHGQAAVSLLEFMGSSEFWFQSLQNWQSEFLGLGTMIVLSIFLRQRGSPESKAVDAAHSETGHG